MSAGNAADKRDLIDPETLRKAPDGFAGEPGVRLPRGLLDRLSFQLSDSELEIRFRPLARAAGLPAALSKRFVNGFEVDFSWPELGLAVETRRLALPLGTATDARDAIPNHRGWSVGVGVRLRAAMTKQLKDAGSPNSSAIWATEDAEMRRSEASSGVRIHPPTTR